MPVFEEPEDPSSRSFFSEIIASISDVKFSHSGRYVLSRDYLTVKVGYGNIHQGVIQRGGVHWDFPPPPQNFAVDFFLILSSSLVANFQPFWCPRSNLRACKISWGSIAPHPPRGRGSMHMFFPTPTKKFCLFIDQLFSKLAWETHTCHGKPV